MPKYYISADGGGTKLISVLFDDDLNCLSNSKSGAVNPYFTDISQIEKNMRSGIESCLGDTEITQIERLYITMPGPAKMYDDILRSRCRLTDSMSFSEGYACLISGLFKSQGLVALSGTGSGVFYIRERKNITSIGGWGALFGDEGSGYEIGAAGIRAAQHAADGRGKETTLVEMIKSQFSFQNLNEIVSYVYGNNNYRGIISSVCLTVCKAAEAGDTVSVGIMKEAGRSQGLMMNTMIKKHHIPCSIPIVVGGSVWRRNSHMFEAFLEYVHSENPCFHIYKPHFDPVMSGVIQMILDSGVEVDNSIISKLDHNFAGYIFE